MRRKMFHVKNVPYEHLKYCERWKRWHLLLSLSDGHMPVNVSVTGEASHGEQHQPHGWSRTGGARPHRCPRHCPHFAHGAPRPRAAAPSSVPAGPSPAAGSLPSLVLRPRAMEVGSKGGARAEPGHVRGPAMPVSISLGLTLPSRAHCLCANLGTSQRKP